LARPGSASQDVLVSGCPAPAETRLGVLAFGDSVTNGGGELQWGVALQSWALWVARALGLPFTSYAVDGARVTGVVEEQIPAFQRRSVHPQARYELGCIYIGTNDVRAPDWDAAGFESTFRQALEFIASRSDRTLTLTAPLDLGRPRAGAKVAELNAAVERVAGEVGALVTDLRGFRGRNVVMADHVHPTALGQIAIAERVLAMLARAGITPTVMPSELIQYEITWWKRLRRDSTYAYRHLKVSAVAGVRLTLSRIHRS
jgi:lysophospholipase L1-like esterase